MPDAPLPPDTSLTQRRLQMLQELAEIGMALARDVQAQATAPADDPAPTFTGDLALVYSRISRAVRQTLALQARLEEEQAAGVTKAAKALGLRRCREARRAVEQAIEAGGDPDTQLREAYERLTDLDDTDFAGRPVSVIVAGICRALGVTPDWSLWEDEDWAIAEAKAGTLPHTPPPQDAEPDEEPWRTPPPHQLC